MNQILILVYGLWNHIIHPQRSILSTNPVDEVLQLLETVNYSLVCIYDFRKVIYVFNPVIRWSRFLPQAKFQQTNYIR